MSIIFFLNWTHQALHKRWWNTYQKLAVYCFYILHWNLSLLLTQYLLQVIVTAPGEPTTRVLRSRVGPSVNSALFVGLEPDTEYFIGVVAYIEHEPRSVNRLDARTASNAGMLWENSLNVARKDSQFTISWKNPGVSQSIKDYIVEYRLPNDNT